MSADPLRACFAPVLAALPPLHSATALDVGCGAGEVAAELCARGARVIGVDLDGDRLRQAAARGLPGARFLGADLREPLHLNEGLDGVWGSFTAAYFPRLPEALQGWTATLRPSGWIALIEIDDLFGHEPLAGDLRDLLDAYARDALAAGRYDLAAGRYDFHMGSKLRESLESAGFQVTHEFTLADPELAFEGRAAPGVIEAWDARLARMTLLAAFCADRWPRLRAEFRACLAHSEHRSRARVLGCIARR